MAAMLTPYERVQKALAREKIDRVPVLPLVSQWAPRFAGKTFVELKDSPQLVAQAHIEGQKSCGYDWVLNYCEITYFHEAFGCSVKFDAGAPSVFKHVPIKDEKDIDGLKVLDIRREGRTLIAYKATEILAEYSKGVLPVMCSVEGPFTSTARIMGMSDMMIGLIDKPAVIKKFIDKVTDHLIIMAAELERRGADMIFVPDPISSGNLISPSQYREFSFPYAKRLISTISKPTVLHICGKTAPIWDDMAATGATILSIDQCESLSGARAKVGHKAIVGGNIDPIETLQKGPKESIGREAKRCISEGGPDGFILMSGCSVTPATPPDNLRFLVEASAEANF